MRRRNMEELNNVMAQFAKQEQTLQHKQNVLLQMQSKEKLL